MAISIRVGGQTGIVYRSCVFLRSDSREGQRDRDPLSVILKKRKSAKTS